MSFGQAQIAAIDPDRRETCAFFWRPLIEPFPVGGYHQLTGHRCFHWFRTNARKSSSSSRRYPWYPELPILASYTSPSASTAQTYFGIPSCDKLLNIPFMMLVRN